MMLTALLLLPLAVQSVGTPVPYTQSIRNAIVASHNKIRGEVSPRSGVPLVDLTYDSGLEAYAAKYASQCIWGHNPDNKKAPKKGENLAMGSNLGPVAAVDLWGSEIAYWKYGKIGAAGTCTPPPKKACGHYTQIIWEETTKIGCATQDCPGGRMTVCNYQGPANLPGKYPYLDKVVKCDYEVNKETKNYGSFLVPVPTMEPAACQRECTRSDKCKGIMLSKCSGDKCECWTMVSLGSNRAGVPGFTFKKKGSCTKTAPAAPAKTSSGKTPATAAGSGKTAPATATGSGKTAPATATGSGKTAPIVVPPGVKVTATAPGSDPTVTMTGTATGAGATAPETATGSGKTAPATATGSGKTAPAAATGSGKTAPAAPAGVPAGCTASASDMNEQNDLPNVDFQKALTSALSTNPTLAPFTPVCTLEDKSIGMVTVRETFQEGWSCAVANRGSKNLLVRVQTTKNSDNPKEDKAWDFYYYVPAGKTLLANPGRGGERAVCRLCGAQVVTNVYKDMTTIKALEQNSYAFQCRRRCEAVFYQHRNFNGLSATVTMNLASLKAAGLDDPAKISSMKIFGERCEVRLYAGENYQNKACTFTVPAGVGAAAWDMDAMRTKCCGSACPSGQDCAKSVAIRDMKPCGPGASGTDGKPAACPNCIRGGRDSMTEFNVPARAQHLVALQRLFKAMADVLED